MIALVRAAWVIGRRDFMAIVASRSFFLFLLGPLFPLLIGVGAGSLTDRIARETLRPTVGLTLPAAESARLMALRAAVSAQLGDETLPMLRTLPPATARAGAIEVTLAAPGAPIAILSGTLDQPVLNGKAGDLARVRGDIGLLVGLARERTAIRSPYIASHVVTESRAARTQGQKLTGQAAQTLLFLLVMLLAGMVLSNMIEEKTNKVIEVLAAAVPVDAIFLGKLVAMLAVSCLGIALWGGIAAVALFAIGGTTVDLPAPAVGWPLFVLFALLYFAMAYTLLGALFLGIGAQAGSAREVQMLSMPVTMGQLLVFFGATWASADIMGLPGRIGAAIPFSSPFIMIARAAQDGAVTPHWLALGWQLLWVLLILRIGGGLFRRHVLKSGAPRRGWRRRRAEPAA
jgi:ABC-2 type transport system permease protein